MRNLLCLAVFSMLAGCVQRVSLGSSGERVADGIGDLDGVQTSQAFASASDGNTVFWVTGTPDGAERALMTFELTGPRKGTASILGRASSSAAPPVLAFDDALVYVGADDGVTTARKDGVVTGTAFVRVCGPSAFDVDADAVYCLSRTDGSLIRKEKSDVWAYVYKEGDPFDGSFDPPTPTVTLATGQSASGGLRVDATHVYYQDGAALKRTGKRAPAAPEILATLPSGACDDLFLVDDFVYCAGDASIVRVPKSGGQPPVSLVVKQKGRSACDGRFIYYPQTLPGGSEPRAIARMSLAGGAPETAVVLPPGKDGVAGISVDDAHVYWTGTRTPALYRAPKER